MLDKSACCIDSVHSDIAEKVKKVFQEELDYVAAYGLCPPNLFNFLLILRSRIPLDTQEIEGANSVIQEMSRRSPNLHLALASDRITIKKGDPISVQECCQLHDQVVEQMQCAKHMHRVCNGAFRRPNHWGQAYHMPS